MLSIDEEDIEDVSNEDDGVSPPLSPAQEIKDNKANELIDNIKAFFMIIFLLNNENTVC